MENKSKRGAQSRRPNCQSRNIPTARDCTKISNGVLDSRLRGNDGFVVSGNDNSFALRAEMTIRGSKKRVQIARSKPESSDTRQALFSELLLKHLSCD